MCEWNSSTRRQIIKRKLILTSVNRCLFGRADLHGHKEERKEKKKKKLEEGRNKGALSIIEQRLAERKQEKERL